MISEINLRVAKGNRVLVTTLTKKMAEDLTSYLEGMGIRVRYMHHDIDTVERMEIIRDLRLGEFDVLVGINLLREGLDIPEVSLVVILDADKEGFLRSDRSLIQTIAVPPETRKARLSCTRIRLRPPWKLRFERLREDAISRCGIIRSMALRRKRLLRK